MTQWIRCTALLAAVVCACPAASRAQKLEDLVRESEREEEEIRNLPGTETPGLVPEGLEGRLQLPEGEKVQRLRIAQDRQVDPESYIVGPGDALQLYVWGEFDQNIPFEVNPEGMVLVPTIGTFAVAGRTLADVKREITTAAAREKYPGVAITMTLQSMRFFTVYITGAVLGGDGAYVITPMTRLSDLVELAGGFVDDLAGTVTETSGGREVTRLRPTTKQPSARRSIQLFHQDGTMERVDLGMFIATGDIRHNPYVRMGDIVHVAFQSQQVSAYGAVNAEGAQEYRAGDTVGDLLRLARGVSGNAPLARVELWRFVEESDSTTVIPLIDAPEEGVDRSALDALLDVPLQAEDMLFVRTRSDWRQTPTVHAHGEFRFTGRYRIEPGKTKLTDFVREAGGFTQNANLVESRVIRSKLRAIEDPELARLRAAARVGGLADLDPDERAYLKSKEREVRGRLAIDFERLFRDGDASQDILLEGGDVVFVPSQRLTVSLSGQFRKPGLVEFEPGRRVGFYVDQAGGFSFDADKGGARLIRARTGQREEFDRNLLVEPGDELWVPEQEYRDWWALVQGTMRSTAEALTLILVIRGL